MDPRPKEEFEAEQVEDPYGDDSVESGKLPALQRENYKKLADQFLGDF